MPGESAAPWRVPDCETARNPLAEVLWTSTLVLAALAALGAEPSPPPWAAPAVLVVAAIGPAALYNRNLDTLGLHARRPGRTIASTTLAAALMIAATTCGLLLAHRLNWPVPWRPAPPTPPLPAWALAQLVLAAGPEELFFRGYLLGRLSRSRPFHTPAGRLAAVLVSSAIFALAHLAVTHDPASLATMLPALLFGWLFLRTKSLAAPIALHWLANLAWPILAA